jgi:DNA modification methylase
MTNHARPAGDIVPIRHPAIEHADALDWLARQEPGCATAIVYDPPYAVGTPVRGRQDGAAGSVSGPLSFLQRTMSLCARALRPGGIVIIFGDYKRLPDLMYAATTSGLRLSGCVAWVRTRPGTGGLLRASWDPVLIASRGTPDAVDRAAVRNVVMTTEATTTEFDDVVIADYPAKRRHPYGKPPEVVEHILRRCCRRGNLVLDPFSESGSTRTACEKLGLEFAGCDIDPAYAEDTERWPT